MAINRFDNPVNLAIRDTFVSKNAQLPFQEVAFGLQQKQKTYQDTEQLLNEGLLQLNVNAIQQDIEERNKITDLYETDFDSLVDKVSGDLSLIQGEAKQFSRNITKDLQRGKLSAIENRFQEQKNFFSDIDKKVQEGKLSANKAQLLKTMSSSLTPQLEKEDGGFNGIAKFPVSEEVSVFERGLELTKNLAKDGFLPGLIFDPDKEIIVNVSGEKITPEKAFKAAFQAISTDRLSNDSLNQDASLLLFTTRGQINDKALDSQISRYILLNNRDKKGNILDYELEQDIETVLGGGSNTEKLKLLSELQAANNIANQISGSKFNRSINSFGGGSEKKEKKETVFGDGVAVPINTKFNPINYDTPDKIAEVKKGLSLSIKKARNEKEDFLKNKQITEFNPITPDGIDLSGKIKELNANIKQLELDQNDIIAGEKRAMESAGLTTEKRVKLEQEAAIEAEKSRKSFSTLTTGSGKPGTGLSGQAREAFIQKRIEEQKNRILSKDPIYAKYQKALKDDSLPQTLTLGVVQISNNKTKNATENAVKTILGNVGTGEASQAIRKLGTEQNEEEIITNEEISKMKKVFVDGITFTPESGSLQVVFQAADEEGNPIGRFSTKAPNGIVGALIEEDQFEFLDLSLHSFANTVRNSFNKNGEIGGIGFQVQTPTEITNNTLARPYVITYNRALPDGRIVEVPKEFSSEGEALNFMKELLKIKFQRESNIQN